MGNNNWRGFEKLAHRILSELNEKADVKHDDHILGYESEIERQIDVSIRANVRGQNILTIVQAKNWATPADINTVGEFSAVVRDVRANRGILVCRSGFTLQAKVYAQNLGIELLNLHDAQSKDWNIEIRIPIIWVEEIPTARIALEYSLDENFNQYDDVFLINDNGEPRISPDRGITGIDIWSTFEDRWNDFTLNRTPGPEHTLEYSDITLYLAVGTDRQNISQSIQWIPINSLSVKYVVEKKLL